MRRPSLWTIAAVPVLLGIVGNLAAGTVEIPSAGRLWIWALTVLLVFAAIVIEFRRGRSDGRRSSGQGPDLDKAAGQLAQAVGAQWRREDEHRRVHDPFPLPVRWHTAAHLVDHWANILQVPIGRRGGPLALAGRLEQIASIYARIPSGRLVVLGRAGSGKTILMLRFVLDRLDARRSADPVPVIFSLGSWNPATTPLRDWLAQQLVRDHPGLAVPGPAGSSLAAALVDAGRVLPILDGFDEIPAGLHKAALQALNTTAMPLLVTSRPAEYAAAVTAVDVLTAAAGIELDDLTVTDLTEYLPRTTRPAPATGRRTGTSWDPVLAHLRMHPTAAEAVTFTTALATPLMVGLARAIYSDFPDRDPRELLDTGCYPDARSIQDHLLATFVPAVYQLPPVNPLAGRSRRRWAAHDAERWLGHLATHLDRVATRDLAWWQLGDGLPRRARILAFGLAFGIPAGAAAALDSGLPDGPTFIFGLTFGIAVGLLFGAVVGPAARLVLALLGGLAGGLAFNLVDGFAPVSTLGITSWLTVAPAFGLASGLAAALTFGLVAGVAAGLPAEGARPSQLRLRLRGRARRALGRFAAGFANGCTGGLVFGLAFGFTNPTANGLLVGLMVGLTTGLARAFTSAFEEPVDVTTVINPANLLASDRRNAMFQSLVIGLAFAIVMATLTGLPNAVAAAFAAGFAAAVTASAWGRWMILVRIWLPLTDRLPWSVTAFLDDAYQRGVLRQAGAVYQFRHAQLQDQLAHGLQPTASPDNTRPINRLPPARNADRSAAAPQSR